VQSLVALALASGAASLIYEAVWLRWFRLLFGNTAYAASATLTAFFAGMALGAWWFGRRAARSPRPLVTYAWIEAATGATALLVPLAVAAYEPLYASLYEQFSDQRAVFVAVKFALALAAVIPTATLLGGTLPMLATAFIRDPAHLGRGVGLLYACNTLGAALGSAAGSLWLPEALGVTGAYAAAIALSLAVAATAGWMATHRSSLAAPATVPGIPAGSAPRRWLGLAFLSGFGVLAFEVLLIQTLGLALENSVYSFGAVLIVVLLTLAAAAAAIAALPMSWTARRWQSLLSAALLVESLLLLGLPWAILTWTGGLARYAPATFGNGLALAAGFGGLVLLVAGTVLPLSFRLVPGGAVGPRVGGLLAANTLGGIAGSLVASFVLLDGLGLWASMSLLAALYAGGACAFAPSRTFQLGTLTAAGAAAAVTFLSDADPRTLPVTHLRPNQRLVAVEEGAHGIVAVVDVLNRRFERDRRLQVDGRYTLSGALARQHQERLGHLPLLLHGRPRRALYVGSATGETASAAMLHPLDEVTLVELVPEVQELAAIHFAEHNRGIYSHERTRVVVEDGRNHLRGAPELYDVIVFDLFVPQRPGVGAMYSVDNFRAVRERLRPGGLLCVWLPVHQLDSTLFGLVAESFLAVFPEATLWRGDFFTALPTAALVGFRDAPPSAAALSEAASRLGEHGVDDRWLADPRGLWMLYQGPLAAVGATSAEGPHRDDRPLFEYLAGRSNPAKRHAFRRRVWPKITQHLLTASERQDARGWARPGGSAAASAAMAEAQRLVVGRENPRWEEAAALLRREVPAELLATPDRTVAEAWPTLGP